jgi:hypothetical protein
MTKKLSQKEGIAEDYINPFFTSHKTWIDLRNIAQKFNNCCPARPFKS